MESGTTRGRPRDGRIDDAVLASTVELLERDGYMQLTIAAIAARAGTTKPAIYRRWPTKAHLVHDAVFPPRDVASIPLAEDLRGSIRDLVVDGLDLLGRPAARAALPGLLAETASDPLLQVDVFSSAAGGTWEWLHRRLAAATEAGDVRAGVQASTVFELIAGAAFVATAIRPPDSVDDGWIDEVVDLIVRGITS